MMRTSDDVTLGELATLFQLGTVGDADDDQLLERFLTSRDSGVSDLLKYIKAATTDPMTMRSPSYVVLAGLAELGQTETSPVSVVVD